MPKNKNKNKQKNNIMSYNKTNSTISVSNQIAITHTQTLNIDQLINERDALITENLELKSKLANINVECDMIKKDLFTEIQNQKNINQQLSNEIAELRKENSELKQ